MTMNSMPTNAMPATEMDTMLTAVRQFAIGLPDGEAPSAVVVEQAERLVHAAFEYTIDPQHHCMDDGDLGWILQLRNGDLVLVTLSPDGSCLWGHAKDDETGDDEYAKPGQIDDIVNLLKALDNRHRFPVN